MWPWEHVIVGYVAYSLFSHLVYREGPSGAAALAVVFAALFPDLLDKTLSWQFGLFPGGYSVGHSVFVAVPLSVLAGVLAHRVGRPRVGLAFGAGYLLHLPSDVIPDYPRYGRYPVERVLWPLEQAEGEHGQGLISGFLEAFLPYAYQLLTLDPSPELTFQLGLMGCAFLLWTYDGMPVLRELVVGTHRRITKGGL
ncbi:metal-dependent hydrolase [Halalkalicoccus jeotgali]|uniref:Membrane-bound metal-dependent hydrolase n=1 Tax=Halalkalicoccus jeotgali (strain DSM 18796 / CECT 7217 / JCM 14584 / KCTC 4019 / B3) TaxID=795797 RepID=D8J4H3_HALJB|nr:metal-dependent hydrolase [Halalkalicoccus jeotgali]ADJ13535.1 membrane-bound metal-dependent hydrolase [Halalkalicoccus jeotgali B3]ELY32990.1 membrane-bound metal-dependent hydrolase [Halalkalicoccus jeotgali B3]